MTPWPQIWLLPWALVVVVVGLLVAVYRLRRSVLDLVWSWTNQQTSIHVPTYIGAGDGGPLPSNTWDAPDQVVEGEGDPDSVWPIWGGDLSNTLPLDLTLILKLTLNLVLTSL
jgi:hypothetical protein